MIVPPVLLSSYGTRSRRSVRRFSLSLMLLTVSTQVSCNFHIVRRHLSILTKRNQIETTEFFRPISRERRNLVCSNSSKRRSKDNRDRKKPSFKASTLDANNDNGPTFIKAWRRKARMAAGEVIAAGGFVFSVTSALAKDSLHIQRLRPTARSLKNYLRTSGIELEFSRSLTSNLLTNMIILARIQQSFSVCGNRREFAAVRGKAKIPDFKEALRYMKYATAVYGESMIRAAEMENQGKFDSRFLPLTRQRISEHINIPEEDIILMDVDYEGPSDRLRHFVAIDHKRSKVVLAIRGTFSISDVMVDVAAFSRPFCGGEAHSEMANMAERIWDAAGGTVLRALRDHEDYELIITGHSLGAGAACLVNILCHRNGNDLIRRRQVRCFAYASPPVFTPLEAIPRAVKSTTNYVHGSDVVSFLSVHSLRQFFSCVRAIDKRVRTMGYIQRLKLVTGFLEPDDSLVDAVHQASLLRQEPKEVAPVLAVPGKIVWIEQDKKCSGKYDFKVCDPFRFSKLSIQINPSMIRDHYPQRYEHVLHTIF